MLVMMSAVVVRGAALPVAVRGAASQQPVLVCEGRVSQRSCAGQPLYYYLAARRLRLFPGALHSRKNLVCLYITSMFEDNSLFAWRSQRIRAAVVAFCWESLAS